MVVEFFLFVWAMNGYCQSLGWTPCVRVLGNWVPVHRRGKAMGIVGTGYQFTAALTFVVSGAAVWAFGWRGALWVPPAILLASADSMDAAVLKSAIKYAILPIGGIAGSLCAGWVTDRFFGSRRAPVICGLLVTLGCLTLVYDSVAKASFVGTMFLLLAIGFTIYGPQVLLVGTAPADLAKRGTSAAAAGFVNCIGYVGAALLGDLLTGHLAKHYGWEVAIFAWAGWAFFAAILVAILWNRKGDGSHRSSAVGND